MTYRTLFYSLLTLVLLVVATGCDSTDSDQDSATDILVGTWAVVSISDDTGDLTGDFTQIVESLTVDLQTDNDFTLILNYNEQGEALGQEDINLTGTYSINESSNEITLTLPTGGALTFDYEIENAREAVMTTGAGGLNVALQPAIPYQGTVTLEIEKLAA